MEGRRNYTFCPSSLASRMTLVYAVCGTADLHVLTCPSEGRQNPAKICLLRMRRLVYAHAQGLKFSRESDVIVFTTTPVLFAVVL